MTRGPLDGELLGPQDYDPKDEERVRRRFWPTLRKAIRQIPLTEDLVAGYYCALDPEVPLRIRATLIGALVYFVSPIDALPDAIPGIGFTDDVSVLLAAITLVASYITEEHRQKARRALWDGP